MKNKEKLFVYGTLRDENVQKKVFGRIAKSARDALVGYKKSEIVIGGETYPVLVPDSGSIIEGRVLEISPKELKLIDEYETDAYKRVKVVLKSGESVWVYVKN